MDMCSGVGVAVSALMPQGPFVPQETLRRFEIVTKLSGSINDALTHFKTMTEGATSTQRIFRDGKDIRISTLEDGTTVTFRNFSDSERNANAVIEVNNANVGDKVTGRALEMKFFDAPKE